MRRGAVARETRLTVGPRDGLDEWSQWPAVVGFVICRGLIGAAGPDRRVARVVAEQRSLAAELVRFVRSESSQARLEERLPGSTAVLESCFGKFKARGEGACTGRIHRAGPDAGSVPGGGDQGDDC